MKKIIIMLALIALVATASLAAMRIGAQNLGGAGGFGTYPTIGMQFNDAMSGDLGLAIGQNAAGTNSNIGILLRLEWNVGKIGEVKTTAGGNLLFSTNPGYAAAATSSFSLNGFLGVEYMLTKNVGILANLTLLELTSTGGASTLGLGSGTAYPGSGLGAGSANIYTGARIYL